MSAAIRALIAPLSHFLTSNFCRYSSVDCRHHQAEDGYFHVRLDTLICAIIPRTQHVEESDKPLGRSHSKCVGAFVIMKTGQRSKAGCWTCKLRKKKCDETHPQCSTCQSLKIDCYGYANRPSWMDGGAQERKIVRDLRLRVKETLSQKRRSRTRLGPQVSQNPSQIGYCPFQEVSLAIDIESTSSVAAGCTVGEPDADLAAGDTTCAHEFFPTPATSLASAFAARTKDTYRSSQSLTQVPLDEWEAGLWMHYLDKTFPHQFPFYKPTTREGGRGWLLMLVVQTEE